MATTQTPAAKIAAALLARINDGQDFDAARLAVITETAERMTAHGLPAAGCLAAATSYVDTVVQALDLLLV